MKRWAMIHAASGAILAINARKAAGNRDDVIIEIIPEDVSSETHWWDGSAFALREDAVISVPYAFAEVGQEIILTKPVGAWYSSTSGELANGARAVITGQFKVNRFSLVGQYQGAVSIAVISPGEAIELVRKERDRRLSATDKYTLPDYPINASEKVAWFVYRQSLRDIPEAQPNATPETIEWPTPPHTQGITPDGL